MSALQRYPCVLSVYPNTRGFAFVLFESPLSLVDWGVKDVRGLGKNKRCLSKIEALLDRYSPSVLVIQNMSAEGMRRAQRIRTLNASIAELAERREIPICAYSRADVLDAFAEFGVGNKHDMAEVIAMHIPALGRYVPPPRKPWMSEDARMGLFDAAGLALAFFHTRGNSGQGIG